MQPGVLHRGNKGNHIILAFTQWCLERRLTHEYFRDHSENNLEALSISLTNNNLLSLIFKAGWDECINFGEELSLFSPDLYIMYDSWYPIRTKIASNNRISKPWLVPDIMILNQRNFYFYKQAKHHAIAYSFYRAYCSALGKKVNKAKTMCF